MFRTIEKLPYKYYVTQVRVVDFVQWLQKDLVFTKKDVNLEDDRIEFHEKLSFPLALLTL